MHPAFQELWEEHAALRLQNLTVCGLCRRASVLGVLVGVASACSPSLGEAARCSEAERCLGLARTPRAEAGGGPESWLPPHAGGPPLPGPVR